MRRAALVLLVVPAVWGAYVLFGPGPAIKNTDATGRNIICFGDSLSFGTGASEGNDYPSRLAARIDLPVINAGVPGDTAAEALERLDRDVLSRSPRMVLLTLGGNDLKNGVPREKAFADLRAVVKRIQEAGALVVIGGVDIPFYGRGYGEAYEDLAEETGSVLVPNVYRGILGEPGRMSDRIHPNDKGYAVMARHFHDAIEPYL
jgi:lysophospholipase L1-like esterase